MFRYAILAAGILALTTQAEAISRYNSESRTCRNVQAIINSEGAAIMRYSSRNNASLMRYDRYVANDYLCPAGYEALRTYIPTADRASCPVLHCKVKTRDRFLRRPWFPHRN